MPYREPAYPGEIYHIYNRGVDKRKIFLNDQDYLRFILGLYWLNDENPKYDIWSNLNFNKEEALKVIRTATTGSPGDPVVAYKRKRLVKIYAFTLMSNHYHVILTAEKDNGLSKFMKKINGGYARYFNNQNKRNGSLFEGPYQAKRVKSEVQLANLFNYVHTNQVEIVEPGWKMTGVQDEFRALSQLKTYPWTSYHDYIGRVKFPLVTQRDFYLDLFGDTNGCRQSVEDWVKFKAQNADLPNYLKKLQNYDVILNPTPTTTTGSPGDPVVNSVGK